MENLTYSELSNRILAADDIVIFTHIHMDGDALGSSSALCLALRKLGRKAAVLCIEKIPGYLDFLEKGCVIGDLGEFGHVGLAIMLDCGSLKRIPGREEAFLSADVKAVLDHHGVTENDVEFDFGRVEPDAAATGEMVYLLIREMGVELDLDIADCLYAAISTDCGNYQYSNTTARTHEISADIHRVPGFNSKTISSLLYDRNTPGSLKLESMVIDCLHLYADGKVVVSRVTQQMLDETGCEMSESEGFIQKLLSICGVEVACLLKEAPGVGTRASLRAKHYADVAAVAHAFGGGGHVRAAGCTLHCGPDEAEEMLAPALIEAAQLK